MRALLLLFLILAAGALALLGLRGDEPPVPPVVTPSGATDVDGDPDPPVISENTLRPAVLPPPAGDAADGREDTPQLAPQGPTRSFHGAALIQRDGELLREAAVGTIEMDLLQRGSRTRVVANVREGRFEVEVPVAARVLLMGGQFESEEVHFEQPKGPFDPTDDDYALIGVVTPRFLLDVRDGGQGAPVKGVQVQRAEDATSALMGDDSERFGAVIVEGAESPVRLPYIDVKRPVWLSVSAPGYARTHVLVDPRKSGEKRVALWPGADLTVKVTGAGRGSLRMLVLTRDEGLGGTPHAGTFGVTDPAVESGPSETVFPIRGLAALPHMIQAKGYDPRGVTVNLADPVRVELGPNDQRTVEIRLPAH